MTEQEWLAGKETVGTVVEFVFFDTPTSDRKLRLFACACSRRVDHLIGDAAFVNLLAVAESYADGEVSGDALMKESTILSSRWKMIASSSPPAAISFACRSVGYCRYLARDRKREKYQPYEDDFPYPQGASQCAVGAIAHSDKTMWRQEERLQVALLRDIFGNPFRPVTIDPRWLTTDVVQISRGIYEDRAFDRLPILSDALLDAGCDNDGIINHCRSEGPHVRGCWVVDLLLGKS